MDKELQMCKDAASACGQIQLEFERVVFTDTGTLLLTWVDMSGNVEQLRARFRTDFPGVCADSRVVPHEPIQAIAS